MSNDLNIPHTHSTLEGKFKRMETEVLISEDMKLSLTTYQRHTGDKCLLTYASVSKRLPTRTKDDAFLYGHSIGQDYHRVFKATKCRVTANAVKAQHGEFLVNLAGIVEDAKKYYGVSIVKVEAT